MRRPVLQETDELFPAAMKVADEGAAPDVLVDLAASCRTAEPRARTPSTVAFLDDSHRRKDGLMEGMVSATSIKPPSAEGLLEAITPVSHTRARTRTRSGEVYAEAYLSPSQHEEPFMSDSERHSDGAEDGKAALADVASHLPLGSEAPALDLLAIQTRQDTPKDIPDEHGETSELPTARALTPAREVPKEESKGSSALSSAEETLVNVQVIAASEVNVATEVTASDESTQEAKHVDHVDTETAAGSGHHEAAEEADAERVAAEEADSERVAAEKAKAERVAPEKIDEPEEVVPGSTLRSERLQPEDWLETAHIAYAQRTGGDERALAFGTALVADSERAAAEEADSKRVAAAEYAEAEEARRRGSSAVKIQSCARGKRGRKKAKQRVEAMETIQAHARGEAARKKTNPMRKKKRTEEARKKAAAEKAEAERLKTVNAEDCERLKTVRLAENAEAARHKAEASKLDAEQAEAKAAIGGATAKRVATQKRLVADKVGEAADKEGEAAAAHAAVMARKQERAAKKEAARLEWIAKQQSQQSQQSQQLQQLQ